MDRSTLVVMLKEKKGANEEDEQGKRKKDERQLRGRSVPLRAKVGWFRWFPFSAAIGGRPQFIAITTDITNYSVVVRNTVLQRPLQPDVTGVTTIYLSMFVYPLRRG